MAEAATDNGQSADARLGRRAFVGGIGALATLAAVGCQPLSPLAGGGGSGGDSSSDPFARGAWSGLVGESVTLTGPSGQAAASIDSVSDVAGAPAGDATSFAVNFQARTGSTFLDAADSVQLADGSQRAITVLPTDQTTATQWYQAVVFNPTH